MANYNGYKGIYSPSTSFGRKFAEKSRYDSMVSQMDEETKKRYVNDEDYRYEVDKSFGFKEQYNNPIFQDENYKISKTQGSGRGALSKVIDFLQTGAYASAGFSMGLAKGEGIGGALNRAGEGFTAGFTGNDEKSYHYSDVLSEMGQFEGHDTARKVTGFIGDVLLDPTTYLGIGLIDDLAKGTGKVVKGTVAGADDVVTKTGGKSVIKAMTDDDAVKVFKSLKGDNYVPKVEEVTELIRRTNQTRGIRETQPITAFGKELISGDTMNKLRSPMRALGDKTIAPYAQKVKDFLVHSKLSTKGELVDLARTNPTALKQYFDFAEEAGKHGLSHSQAIAKAEEQFGKLDGVSDEVNALTIKLLEDEKLYNKMASRVPKEAVQTEQPVAKATQQTEQELNGTQTSIFDKDFEAQQKIGELETRLAKADTGVERILIKQEIRDIQNTLKPQQAKEVTEKVAKNVDVKPQEIRNFQDGWGVKKENIPTNAKVIPLDNMTSKELSNGRTVSTRLSVDKTKRGLPNPHDYKDEIGNIDKVAKQYKIDFIPQVDDSRVATTGNLYLKGTDMPVNFMRPGYLEGSSITELKDIAMKMRVGNYNKYTNKSKNEIVQAIKDKFDPTKYVKESRSKLGLLERYNIDVTDVGKATTSLKIESKRKLINDIIKEDEYIGNIYTHMIKQKQISTTHLSEEQMNTFITKYFEGDLRHFTSTSHQLNKNYTKASAVIADEFGKRETLTRAEKALRMDKMWDYLNNPKLLNKKYEKIELKNSFGTKGLDAELEVAVDSVTKDTTVKSLRPGSDMSNPIVDTKIVKGKTPTTSETIEQQLARQNKNVSDFENSRYKNREYDGTGNDKAINTLDNKIVKTMMDNGSFDKSVSNQHIRELDSLINRTGGKMPDNIALREIEGQIYGTPITGKELTTLMRDKSVKEMEQRVKTALAEKGIKNVEIKEVKALSELNKEIGTNGNIVKQATELSRLPKEMQARIVKPSKDVQDAVQKINNLKPEQYEQVTMAFDNVTKEAEVVKKVFGEDVEKVATSAEIKTTLTDTERQAYELAKEIRESMKQIGADEVAIGKLSEKKYQAMMDSYISHVMTPQAKGLWEGLKKSNPDIYNIMQAGNKGNQFAITRAFTKGTTLPDGYVLKTGSIEEINEHMAQYLNGNKMFADKISDIYLARMSAHEAVMYDYKLADDMVSKFGSRMQAGTGLGKGETGIIKTADIKNAMSKLNDTQKKTLYEKLGLEEGYFEGTYKPFMNLTPAQAGYLSKSKGVPVYKVSKVMADKADSLAKTQFATDLHVAVKMYDKFLTLWKTNVTATRPGFHFRNAQSNAFQNYLDVGMRAYNPVFNGKMALISEGKEGFHTIMGKKYSFQELREKAVQYGVVDKGFFEKDLGENTITALDGKINPKYNPLNAKEFALYKTGRKFGNKVENQARIANFVANLERGKGFQEASEHTNKFLFDYSDLTPFEQNVMKRIVPFYTWLRKNVPLQAEMITSSPQKYLPFIKAIDRMNEGKGEAPDYAKNWVQLPYTTKDKDGKEYNIMWNNSLPYNDLGKVTSLKDMWGGISPFIKVPVELIAGKNIYFEQDIKGKRGEYLKEQVPLVYETNKLKKASGKQQAVVASDYIAGTGLRTMETEESKKKSSSGNRFSAIYQRYLKEKANK